MAIAFFDLDKTLIAENSAKLWLRTQWRSGEIKLLAMMQASYWLAKYHLGFTKLDDVILKSLAVIEGENRHIVGMRTKEFYMSTIRHLYRPGALRAIEFHKQQGDIISLLTSSFDELASLVQEELGFEYRLCTMLEIDEYGFYTGKTVGAPCFGRNKLVAAADLCSRLNSTLADAIFYTDSASDLPVMKQVGRAVAVNPDPHLRARAQYYAWEIVDWGLPNLK